jgi:hypothetical protein
MRIQFPLAAICVLAIGAQVAKKDVTKRDMDSIQGTWQPGQSHER